MILSNAINAFASEMSRAQLALTSQDRYVRELQRFAKHVSADRLVADLGVEDVRSFIDTFDHHAPSTVALEHTILSSFFTFLVENDYVERNPMLRVRRPKVPRERARTRISSDQVEEMLNACETWSERLCLYSLAHLGVRRTALSNLRWRDVDGKRWTATFREKGNKVIAKPIPHQLRKMLTAYAIERSAAGDPIHPDEWVVPNKAPMRQLNTRSARIIYVLVKDVARRCGINAHVHAFRAAFAVHFLRANPSQLEPLRQLLGHESISTTQVYLTELQGEDAMRVVVDLNYDTKDAA